MARILGVGAKLKPLHRRRIWVSDRCLFDKLATYVFAHIIQLGLLDKLLVVL